MANIVERANMWTMLFTLTLVVSGVMYPTAVLGQRADGGFEEAVGIQARPHGHTTRRYLVTYMSSQAGLNLPTQSATVVTVTNQSDRSSVVTIDWFKEFATTSACTTTFVLESELTTDFCSRSLPLVLTVCNSTCSPELTFDEGRAVVSSQTERIAVSARVYYTRPAEEPKVFGEEVVAITDSKVVHIGRGNRGD
jgi:hypothetical protein